MSISHTKSPNSIIGINIDGVIHKINKSYITSPILGDKDHFFNMLLNHQDMVQRDKDGNFIIEKQDGIEYLLEFMISNDKESFLSDLYMNNTSGLLSLQSAANFACMMELSSYLQKRIDLLENKFYQYGNKAQSSVIVTNVSNRRMHILSTKVFRTINSPFVKYNNNIDFLVVKSDSTSGTISLYLSQDGSIDCLDGLSTLPFRLPSNTYCLVNVKYETQTSTLIYTFSLPCGKILNSSKVSYYGLTADVQLGIFIRIDEHCTSPYLCIRQYMV